MRTGLGRRAAGIFAACLLLLAGCKSPEPAPADQVAAALYELTVQDEAVSLKDALGAGSVREVRELFPEKEGVRASLKGRLETWCRDFKLGYTEEELKGLSSCLERLLDRLTASASLKEEKNGKAVVELTIRRVSKTALKEAWERIGQESMDGLDKETMGKIAAGDEEAITALLRQEISQFMEELGEMEPDGETVLLVECRKRELVIDGKKRPVWLPVSMEALRQAVEESLFP